MWEKQLIEAVSQFETRGGNAIYALDHEKNEHVQLSAQASASRL